MKNSRLSLIFNTFSKKEIRDLRKWLISPAHNQRQDVRDLFEYLTKNIENDNEKAFEKERIFKKLFPKENYDDARFRQTIHFLTKTVEEFLIYHEIKEDQVRSYHALAKVYRKRKLDKLFSSTMKAAKTIQTKSPFRNEHFLRNEFLLQSEEYAYSESQGRTVEMNIQEVVDTLEISFFANKLKYSCVMLAHNAVYKSQYRFGFIDELLSYIEKEALLNIPAIAVYYYGFKTMTQKENPEHFHSLKNEIFKNTRLFPRSEARDIYLMAINFLIKKMHSGDHSAIQELFEFYKSGLENKILIEENIISRFTYINIVAIGLKLAKFEWVDSFIEKYEKFIHKKHRENIVHFSKANLAYVKKDYQLSMRLLMQADYSDTLLNLTGKNMLVKMLYEENEFDTLESLLSSMRTYLTRKKVMGYHKGFITNFIKLTQRLLKIQPYDKSQIAKLRAEIEQAKPMAPSERDWLLSRLELL